MEDKDVGLLWENAKLPAVIALIRKLVEERVQAYDNYGIVTPPDHLTLVLTEFGIDPATWKEQP